MRMVTSRGRSASRGWPLSACHSAEPGRPIWSWVGRGRPSGPLSSPYNCWPSCCYPTSLPPFPSRTVVLLLSFSPSHTWACPCFWRRRLAVTSVLSATLCHCLVLPDGTATTTRALAAPTCGHAHSRSIPMCALARRNSHAPNHHRL